MSKLEKHKFTIYLTDEERREIRIAAAQRDQSMTEFIRNAALEWARKQKELDQRKE